MDRAVLNQLRRYSSAFKDARERGANESDTVMFLVKFFEEVLGWDSFKGEISKESPVKDRFCDIALKINGQIKILVECKAAGTANLIQKNIEQAENYASHSGVQWVALTNGIEWQLYHLTFAEKEGIQPELAFRINLINDLEQDADDMWSRLGLLARKEVDKGSMDDYWAHQKALCKGAVVRAIFAQDVLIKIRRELNRHSPARLEIEDVFASVRDTLSKEALLEAGDIAIHKKHKHKRKNTKINSIQNAADLDGGDDDLAENDTKAHGASVTGPTED